ncbi:hypothetical protein C0995_013146 [Termitomyces sp. Mi166|nr:hypothetical protein C0995_013146 [Termitomyces sp. Mi166\
MLPPPIPPQGPDSRPPSPVPRPRPRSRSRSRSSTAMAFCRGDEEGDEGDDATGLGMDAEVDAVAINALRGVRVANAKLGEERRKCKSLLAQINTLTTTHESLKHEHSSTSAELRSALEELAKRKEEASIFRADLDKANRKRGEEKERVEALRRGIKELGESYAALKAAFDELKDSHEKEKRFREEAQHAKVWAGESLKKLEPLLEDDRYLAKEARGLVTSLQDELADSRRVIDLLRDKLHHLSSALAEAQNQSRELEDAGRESREQVKSFLEKVEKGAEERCEVAKRRMEEMEGELKALRECRDAKLAQDLRLEHLTKKLADLEETHIATTAALDAARSERIELGGINDGLLRSLAEAEGKRRSDAVASEKELDAVKKMAGEAEEKYELSFYLSERWLIGRCGQSKTDGTSCGGEFQRYMYLMKDANGGLLKVLQERFDAQAMTLRLTKEQYGDIQERLQVSEDTLSKTRVTLDTVRSALEAERAEVSRIKGEALERVEELRQSDARLAELKEQCMVLKEGEKRADNLEEALSGLRKIQETQTTALEQADSRYIELEVKMREALKEKAKEINALKKESKAREDELHKAEVKIAACSVTLQEQLEAREMGLQQNLKEKRDEIAVLKKSEKSKKDESVSAARLAQVKITTFEMQEAALKQNLEEITDEIETLKKEGKTKEDELHKAEVKIVALQEQFKGQEVALKQTQGRYSDLQKASATLAEDLTTAQNALEEARQEVLQHAQDSMRLVKLCERIEGDRIRAEEERSRTKEEEERLKVDDERVKELMLVVERLEGEKRVLMERTGRLRESYMLRHEQNDDEKDFAEWLMSLARSLHEEEDVVKNNELRRKENAVIQLQTKIRELESSLAHLIKEKENFSGGTTKSMIDLDAFMTSSPSPCITEVSLPLEPIAPAIINAAPTVQPLPAKAVSSLTKPLDPAPAPVPITKQAPVKIAKIPAPKKTIGTSFSSLDESDSEEEVPLSEVSATTKTVLGKRDRMSSPHLPQDVQQPIQSIANSNLKTYTGSRSRNGAASRATNASSARVSSTAQKAADTKSKKKRK